MRANFTTFIKKRAIKNVPAFHDFSMRQIKVISNSTNYPNSVTLSMDIYCDNVDGYIFNNASTNEQYALTAIQLSEALQKMINNRKCYKPNSKSDLLRLTFDIIESFKF